MPPGESAPEKTAPQPLYLVQRFVNSVDLENGEDELTCSRRAARLAGRARPDGHRTSEPPRPTCRRAVDVREGLRALLLANNGLPLDEERVERLDAAVGPGGRAVRFRADAEPELVPEAGGVDGALAR